MTKKDDAAQSKKQAAKTVEGELVAQKTNTPNEVAIANDDEAKIIAERLINLSNTTDWDLPISDGKPMRGTDLDNYIDRKDDQVAVGRFERGLGLLLKKRELGHGQFMGWAKDTGRSHRSINEEIKIATWINNLNISNSRRAANLPQRKLDVLSRLPAAIVDDMFNEGDLDNAGDMTREDLQEIVKLRKGLECADQKAQRMSDTITQQDEQLRKQSALPETQLYVLELRRAAQEETEALRANLAALQTILDQVQMLPQDIAQADIDSIAHPLMYALQGLHASAGAVFEDGFETFSSFKPDMDVMPAELHPEELEPLRRRAREFADRVEQRGLLRKGDVAAESVNKRSKG